MIALFLGVLLLVPLVIIQSGFAPEDDLMRDVTKAVSGRPWGDVVLLRDGLNPNLRTHAGWDMILGALHRIGLNQEGLLVFGIVALSFVAFLPAAIFLRRPETYLFLLMVTAVVDFRTLEALLLRAAIPDCLRLPQRLPFPLGARQP